MAATPTIDEARAEEFLGRALGNFAGTMTTLLCALGDQLGLFRELSENGPATSAELAQRAGVDERYAREWLRGLAAAEYLEHDRESGRYTLPPEHALVFAQEAGPMFLCGGYQMVPDMVAPWDSLLKAFRHGGGVRQDEYGAGWWDGMQRFTASWSENLLLGEWLPALPELRGRLEEGIVAADVGCGSGRAAIKLAEAFPRSEFVGFDAFPAQVERARANAEAAGVGDRVHFEQLDAARGLPATYDLVTTFDVIHDAVDPRGLLRAIREGLADGGTYLMLETTCADDPADNVGPVASLFYGFSVFYCMTTSLAHGGEGLGTCGLPETTARELCNEAGFSELRRVPIEDPFNTLFEARP